MVFCIRKCVHLVLALSILYLNVDISFGELPDAAGRVIDYSVFDDLLRKYLSDGAVDYAKWKKDDLVPFEGYIRALADVSLEGAGDDEKKAFWINAYNAITIYAVLKHIPDNSLLRRVFSVQMVRGFFDKIEYSVAGESLTLNDIENIKLRAGFNDPRIHFVIVCASGSCPKLQNSVFSAAGLDERLDASTRIFLRDTGLNRLDRKNGVLYLSQIFNWFKEDMSDGSGTVIDFVKKYIDEPDAVYLDNTEVRVKYLNYNWFINVKK